MTSWGSINAVLNRLMREGVIAGYRSNRGTHTDAFGLHVFVEAPAEAGDHEALRKAITRELKAEVGEGEPVTVTVDRSGSVTKGD